MYELITKSRAMSPLVATVLLIAFAISLGVVVMSFGSTYYENSRFSTHETNASVLCSQVALGLFELDKIGQVCQGGSSGEGFVNFILVNNANLPIERVQMWIVGDRIFVTELTDESVNPGYPLQGTVPYDFTSYGSIRQVQFIPKIKVPESDELLHCFDKAVKLDAVPLCQ